MLISPIVSVGESVNASLTIFPSSAAKAVVDNAIINTIPSNRETILLPVCFISLLLFRHLKFYMMSYVCLINIVIFHQFVKYFYLFCRRFYVFDNFCCKYLAYLPTFPFIC